MVASMIIVSATLDFADQAGRDDVVQRSAPVQAATRDDEPGCRAYCFAADPVVSNRIQVFELWDDDASLAAHFKHQNYWDMVNVIRSVGLTSTTNRMYLVAKDEPVYGPNGEQRERFFTDGE
jgi:quinol monooxygenase YgiN